jgi:hypothetical protein
MSSRHLLPVLVHPPTSLKVSGLRVIMDCGTARLHLARTLALWIIESDPRLPWRTGTTMSRIRLPNARSDTSLLDGTGLFTYMHRQPSHVCQPLHSGTFDNNRRRAPRPVVPADGHEHATGPIGVFRQLVTAVGDY